MFKAQRGRVSIPARSMLLQRWLCFIYFFIYFPFQKSPRARDFRLVVAHRVGIIQRLITPEERCDSDDIGTEQKHAVEGRHVLNGGSLIDLNVTSTCLRSDGRFIQVA